MNVKLHVLFFALALLSVPHVFAADLRACMARAESQNHRLDREDAVRNCFTSFKSYMKRDTCFAEIRKNRSAQASSTLTEDLKAVCFYETTGYANASDCIKESRKFISAGDRDEGVFYCYQVFQEKLDKKQCLAVAKHLIFPGKREHLSEHCLELGD